MWYLWGFLFHFVFGAKRPGLHFDIMTDKAFYCPSSIAHTRDSRVCEMYNENDSIASAKLWGDYLSVSLRYSHLYSSCHPVYQCPLVKDTVMVGYL